MPSESHRLRQARYAEWLYARDLRFGFHEEIARVAANSKHGVINDTPPVELWHAIIPTAHVVELIREQFGPTTITSAYRTTGYNVALYKDTGTPPTDSEHSRNRAIDFKCKTGTPKEWADMLRDMRAQRVFTGGIGIYPTFVHVDTRGTIADWDQR